MVSHSLAEILSGLLETSSFGIIALDSQGRVQAWSRGAERIFGGSAAAAFQLQGKTAKPALADERSAGPVMAIYLRL